MPYCVEQLVRIVAIVVVVSAGANGNVIQVAECIIRQKDKYKQRSFSGSYRRRWRRIEGLREALLNNFVLFAANKKILVDV